MEDQKGIEEENQTSEEQEPIQEKKKKFPWGIWIKIIVILGLLSAIAIPQIKYAKRKAILSSCWGNLRNLGIIVTNYSTDHKGHYPQNIDELTRLGYIKKLPVCPLTGKSYLYEISGWDDVSFTIYCPNAEEHVGPEGPKSRMKPKSIFYAAGCGQQY